MSAAAQPVRIAVDGLDLSITVDGTEISQHVRSWSLSQKPKELPQLVLEGGRLDTVFDGLCQVNVVAPQLAIGDATASFLDAMDPDTIQQLALAVHGWVGGSMTAVTLEVLKDLARGGNGKIGRPDGESD